MMPIFFYDFEIIMKNEILIPNLKIIFFISRKRIHLLQKISVHFFVHNACLDQMSYEAISLAHVQVL